MRKLILFALLIFGLNGFAQTDNTKLNRKEAVRLDSIGQEFHKSQKYLEAIDIFDKALEKDATYGNAIYHRAISIASSGTKSCHKISICSEFKRALKFDAIIDEPTLFFYGCKDLILEKKK